MFGNNQVKWSDHQHLSGTAAWLKSLRYCIISRLSTRRIRHPMEKMCACYQLTPGKPTLDHRLQWIITTKQERHETTFASAEIVMIRNRWQCRFSFFIALFNVKWILIMWRRHFVVDLKVDTLKFNGKVTWFIFYLQWK